jgi:hypothetical protein
MKSFALTLILILSFNILSQDDYIPGRLHKSPHGEVVGLNDYMNPNVGHLDGDKFQIYVDLFEVSHTKLDEDNIKYILNETKRMLKNNSVPLDGYFYNRSTFQIDLNNPDYSDIHQKLESGEFVKFGWTSMIDKNNGIGFELTMDNNDWFLTFRIETFDLRKN